MKERTQHVTQFSLALRRLSTAGSYYPGSARPSALQHYFPLPDSYATSEASNFPPTSGLLGSWGSRNLTPLGRLTA